MTRVCGLAPIGCSFVRQPKRANPRHQPGGWNDERKRTAGHCRAQPAVDMGTEQPCISAGTRFHPGHQSPMRVINPTVTWDPLVRLFHWSLVVFFFLAYILEGDWLSLHTHAGYTVALLVMFRLVWGAIGSKHAQFRDFVASPHSVISYLQQLASGETPPRRGHDPAGAVMILALLLCLTLVTLSGMSLYALEGSGPLAGTSVSRWPGPLLEQVHGFLADLTVVLVGLHVLGVLVISWRHRENLIKAMFTGGKPAAHDE
jgi:cytochrome b